MLLMSYFDKLVTNIGYYYHQGPTDRHVDEESKYCGNERQLNACDVIKTDFCYLPPSQLEIQSPMRTISTKFAHYRRKI